METWQKEHLRKHIPQLLTATICNEALVAQLISDGTLGDADAAMIESKSGKYEKVKTLYDIVETRENGFVAIAKALAECCQSGACKIFTDGLAHHLTLGEISIDLLGNVNPLSAYLDDYDLKEVMKAMTEKLSSIQLIEFYEKSHSNSSIVQIISQAVPRDPPFYIPRTLFKRLVINNKLFQVNCPDIFLFKNIRLIQLTELVKPHRVTSSSSQLVRISTRFIRLENEADWEDIRDIAQAPLHLIKYDEKMNIYMLERTTGGSRVIYDFLERPHTEKADSTSTFVSEDIFAKNIVHSTSSVVCICDLPGMGKTMLLAKLASTIGKCYPNRLVVFIQLSKFIQHLNTSEALQNVNKEFARNALLNYISSSPVNATILDKIMTKGNIHMELFLDGFDEVQYQFIELTKKLLSEIAFTLPNTRVYVTSRPHLRHELEASLEAIAYDILPFTLENQIEFLVNSWTSNKEKMISQNKATEFANYIIEKLKTRLTNEEWNITGVPLLCRLVAEIYSQSAKRYCHPSRILQLEDSCHFDNSLPELYKKYVDLAFCKLQNNFEFSSLVKKYHTWIALRQTFPECGILFSEQFEPDIFHIVEDLSASIGLLEAKGTMGENSLEFIHQTFAEYFVSEFLASTLKNPPEFHEMHPQKRLVTLLFQNVLKTNEVTGNYSEHVNKMFLHPSIVYFLNHFTTEISCTSSNQLITNMFSDSVPPTRLYVFLMGCLREDYSNMLTLIQNALLLMDRSARESYKTELVPCLTNTEAATRMLALMNVASVYSSVCLVDQLFHFFLKCFDCNLDEVCSTMDKNDCCSPLNYAVERTDFEMVQLFAEKISLENRKLLLSCLVTSEERRCQITTRKIEICEFLLGKSNSLLDEIIIPPYNVHVEMLKFLFRKGVNPRVIRMKETVVHRAARYMTPSDYHELARFLIDDCGNLDLFKPNKDWKCPLHFILSKHEGLDKCTLEMILNITGVNVEQVDEHENTLLLSAVQGKQNTEILLAVMEFGVNWKSSNRYGQGAFHLAAQNADIQTIKFLLEQGVDTELGQIDRAGNSFLHYFAWNPITPEQYHQIISLIVAEGHSGLFHLRNTFAQLPIHIAIRDVDVGQDTLKLLQENGVDFNSTDQDNWSLLMYAALGRRSVNLLTTLIKMGADVSIQGRDGNTFAHCIFKHFAVELYRNMSEHFIANRGQEATVRMKKPASLYLAANEFQVQELFGCIDFRSDDSNAVELNFENKIGINDTDGKTAAEGNRNSQLKRMMKEIGVDVEDENSNPTTFTYHIVKHYSDQECHDVLQYLVDNGHQNVLQMKNETGATPLHWAVSSRELPEDILGLIKRELVESKSFDINSTDKDGWSLLTYAVHGRRSVPFLKFLMEMGVNLSTQNKYGNTCVHVAPKYYPPEEYHELIKLVFEKKQECVFKFPNLSGRTPIYVAVILLELLPESLVYLFEKPWSECQGSSIINDVCKAGESVLHWAVRGGRSLQFVHHLVELGADWSATSNHNTNLAHLSASFGLIDHLKYFVELGCNVNDVDNDGDNVLQCAVVDASECKCIAEMVQFLLEKDVYKCNTNKKGKSAYMQAVEKGITDELILNALQ